MASWPGILENQLRSCEDPIKALGDLATLLNQPLEQMTVLLSLRAELLARQGKHTDAVSAANKLAELARSGDQLHLAAVAFAWCSRDKAQLDRHAARAAELLAKARDANYFKEVTNIAGLMNHEAFKPLFARDDFKKLLAELEKK